jgi:hypothetical protein
MKCQLTLLLLVALSLHLACQPEFRGYCGDDADCERNFPHQQSRCFFDGRTGQYCASPDRDCSSGYRWSEISGPLSNSCVDPASALPLKDAGIGDQGAG